MPLSALTLLQGGLPFPREGSVFSYDNTGVVIIFAVFGGPGVLALDKAPPFTSRVF